jgi:DNA-binding PucR family transcriptional regulator
MYGLCRRALGAADPSLSGVRDLTELALVTATTAVPELGGLLAAELLGGLDPADPFHRELAGTALAYLDHGHRIDPAAAALHVHPNTVKYRLRRLQELTGQGLDGRSVSQGARWWWALRTFLS